MEIPQQSTEKGKFKQTFMLTCLFGKSRINDWFHLLDYFPLKCQLKE